MTSNLTRPSSSQELANILGVSERRVQQCEKIGIFCNIGEGRSKRYDLGRSLRSWIEYQGRLIDAKRARSSDSRLEQYYAERARKLKLANDKKEESLVDTQSAVRTVDAITNVYITELLRLPARMSQDAVLLPIIEREVGKVTDALRQRCLAAVANLRAGRDPLAQSDVEGIDVI